MIHWLGIVKNQTRDMIENQKTHQSDPLVFRDPQFRQCALPHLKEKYCGAGGVDEIVYWLRLGDCKNR